MKIFQGGALCGDMITRAGEYTNLTLLSRKKKGKVYNFYAMVSNEINGRNQASKSDIDMEV